MCSNCAGDYENPDMTAEPGPDDELQNLLERLDKESRERTKRDCARMLIQLGCIPRSFVNQRLWL
jgi:hypothetical protein